jgi:hypothetical protein
VTGSVVRTEAVRSLTARPPPSETDNVETLHPAEIKHAERR